MKNTGGNKGNDRHADDTDDNQDKHRSNDGQQHFLRAVFQAIKYEHHQCKHTNTVGIGLIQRIAVQEPDGTENNTKYEGPDSTGNSRCRTSQCRQPCDKAQFAQFYDRRIGCVLR